MSKMKRLMQFMVAVGLFTCACIRVQAQEPVTSPSLFPQEKWEITFDNYRSLKEYNNEDYRSLTREVSVVRDGDDIYIEGLMSEYPDSWIKCTQKGQQLSIATSQILDVINGQPVYFHCGSAEYIFSSGNRYAQSDVIFNTSAESESGLTITISDNGETMTANKDKRGNPGAFWYGDKPEGDMRFTAGWHWTGPGDSDYDMEEGFPEVDFMVNMVFRKVGTQGNDIMLK